MEPDPLQAVRRRTSGDESKAGRDDEEEETWMETKINDFLDQWDTFRYFMYNPCTGHIMGRTRKSLAQIGVFFFVFYSCLAAFFAICMVVFLSTVPSYEDGPKYTNIIGRPALRVSTTRVSYSFDDPSARSGINAANKELLQGSLYDLTNASSLSTVFAGEAANCRPPNYGTDQKPCLLFTINRVFDWVPSPSVQVLCTLSKELATGDFGGMEQFSTYPPGGFSVVGGHFPYHPGNPNYRQPVGVIMFDFSKVNAFLGTPSSPESVGGQLECSDLFNQAKLGFTIKINLS